MEANCPKCGKVHDGSRNLFCSCGALRSRKDLESIDVLGFVGVAHSTSPAIEQFLETGEPQGVV